MPRCSNNLSIDRYDSAAVVYRFTNYLEIQRWGEDKMSEATEAKSWSISGVFKNKALLALIAAFAVLIVVGITTS